MEQRDTSAPPSAGATLAPHHALGTVAGDAGRGPWPLGAAKALGGPSRLAARDSTDLPSDLPPRSDLPSDLSPSSDLSSDLPPRSATSLETVVESGARRGSVRPSSSISCRSTYTFACTMYVSVIPFYLPAYYLPIYLSTCSSALAGMLSSRRLSPRRHASQWLPVCCAPEGSDPVALAWWHWVCEGSEWVEPGRRPPLTTAWAAARVAASWLLRWLCC